MNTHHKFNIIIPPQDITINPKCLEKIAAGDRQEFAWLYKNYSATIFDYALLLTNDQLISEDIVQDVFIKIWNKRESLLKVEKFNCWVFILVRNHILDTFSRKKLAQKCLSDLSYGNSTTCPHQLYFKKEVKGLINQAALKLPAQQRLVYLMYREQGLKRDEVAATLKISPHTVKNHDQKTIRFFREYVRERIK